jgi:hypothetical protein
MHPKSVTAYGSKGPFTKAIGTAQPHASYQCFGEYCYVDLRGLHPPKVVEATQHPLEGRQHHSLGLCQERRGYLQSASPGDRGEDSGQSSPDVHPHTSGLHSHRENILADVASCFQEIPDWQLHPSVFRAISARWGSSSIDLFASCASKQTRRFFSCDASAYTFPPIPLLKRVVKKLETSKGTFILVSSLWEAQIRLASLLSLTVMEVCRLPFINNLVTDLTTGKLPSNLHNLHLIAWRISGGSTPSRTSLATPEITRLGGARPQKAATKQPRSPSRDIFVLPMFHPIELV